MIFAFSGWSVFLRARESIVVAFKIFNQKSRD